MGGGGGGGGGGRESRQRELTYGFKKDDEEWGHIRGGESRAIRTLREVAMATGKSVAHSETETQEIIVIGLSINNLVF